MVSKYGRARVKLTEIKVDPELQWLYFLILDGERQAYAANRDRRMGTQSLDQLVELGVVDDLVELFGGKWGRGKLSGSAPSQPKV